MAVLDLVELEHRTFAANSSGCFKYLQSLKNGIWQKFGEVFFHFVSYAFDLVGPCYLIQLDTKSESRLLLEEQSQPLNKKTTAWFQTS